MAREQLRARHKKLLRSWGVELSCLPPARFRLGSAAVHLHARSQDAGLPAMTPAAEPQVCSGADSGNLHCES